ncbi:peptidoglycan-binding protein [Streptomyces sp. NPDC004286]|uniref:peptidoglycan-binding protein n=1 Tax=Streptomyces sp. NPDC004286 TaxID=3364696 RepID=UPI00367D01F1
MPTPPDPERPRPDRVVEPIRVLRARPTDALAELMRELMPEPGVGVRKEPPTAPPADADTEELPPVPPDDDPDPATRTGPAKGTRPGPAKGTRTGPAKGTRPGPAKGARPGPAEATRSAPGAPSASAHRRWAVGLGLAAAALVGFGGALLLPGREEATARPAPPPAQATAAPATTAPSSTDPDGPGTLRQGDSGPEVTDLRRRLLRIPDVFHDGAATGAYDPQLTAAVARFQLWYGIRGDETGVYGDDTRRALESRTGTE